ncbi:MAG TPA: DNA polymerase III subunit delta' [Rhodocyclaceae bacterium]|nr:DNA polymerase III subunit delta' [Rhodocyclaceae bacterium]
MNVVKLNRQVWERLQARRQRLPHALLITGQRGLGKFALAKEFAAGLLCENPAEDGRACGRCLACGWFGQGNHPDFRLLQPEAMAETEGEAEEGKKKASQQITIEQVRGLDDFFNVGTHRSGLRVILVYPTEAMNRNTANALLKSLEEPSPGTLFLLVSGEPMRLLPTIRSRCQVVPVPVPAMDAAAAALKSVGVGDAEQWLALAGGAPLLAWELAQSGQGQWLDQLVKRLAAGPRSDALVAAAEMDKLLKDSKGKVGLRQVVEWMQKWTVDLALAGQSLPVRYFSGQRATIEKLVAGTPVYKFLGFHRRLLRERRQVEQPLNARLFLETLFMDYRALFSN